MEINKSNDRRLVFQIIGCGLHAMSTDSKFFIKPFGWNFSILQECILNKYFHIASSNYRTLSEFILWIKVSEEMHQHLLKSGVIDIHPKDVNSGTAAWIIEFFVSTGSIYSSLCILRDEYMRDISQVTYLRMKNGKCIIKQISRTDYTSFLVNKNVSHQKGDGFLKTNDGQSLNYEFSSDMGFAQTLGELAMLTQFIPDFSALPLCLALERLSRPSKLQQTRLYRDAEGFLYGYISWAWLDAEIAHQDVPAPQDLAPHQWNEGVVLLLCDVFATAAGFSTVCADLIKGLYPGEAMYLRPDVSHGSKAPALKITENALSELFNIPLDTHYPVIDILNLLRASSLHHSEISA